MQNKHENNEIITEIARIFALGYLRMKSMRDRISVASLNSEPESIATEASTNILDIPAMSSNL
jgi:hypothetical protein